MKKLILVMAMMAAMCSWAQVPTWTVGKINKTMNSTVANETVLLGRTPDGILALVPETASLLGAHPLKGSLKLCLMSDDAKVLREVAIPNTDMGVRNNGRYVRAKMVDGKVYVLYSSRNSLLRAVVNPTTMTVEDSSMVVTLNDDHDIAIRVASAWSPNKDYLALETSSRDVMLLTETFETLWQKRVEDLLSYLRVDNDGTVFCMDFAWNQDKLQTKFIFARYTADSEDKRQHSIDGHLISVRLLYAQGDKMVACATKATPGEDVYESKLFQKDKRITYQGVMGLAFSFGDDELKGTFEPFSSDALNCFGNLSNKKPNKAGKADAVEIVSHVPMPYGGVCAMERRWVVVRTDARTGSSTYYSHAMGAVMFAVDTTSRIMWQVPVKTYNTEADDDFYFNNVYLFSEGKDVVAVLPESPKAPKSYDIMAPAKKVNLRNGPAYGQYRITKEGNVEKNLRTNKNITILARSMMMTEPSHYLGTYTIGQRGGFVDIKF